jgi:GTP-binding nuclear protein Ran
MTNLPILGNFNVFVIGTSGVGKTTFIHKHVTGDFISIHTPTTTPQSTPLSFCVEGYDVEGYDLAGIVHLNVHDHVSGESWEEANAAIFMFDNSHPNTINVTIHARQLFSSYHPSVPTVLVGNKNDLVSFSTSFESSFTISTKTNNNYEKPFLYLIQQLLNNSTLEFGEMPVSEIPVVQIPPSLHALALQELEAAGVTPLPDLPDIEENDSSDESDLPDLVSISSDTLSDSFSDHFIQGDLWESLSFELGSPITPLFSSDDEF